jgi:collagenase-like PrtC family protease
MDIQDNVYLTPAENRDDLVRKIIAVCEQIPPEFLLNAAMCVSGRCRMCL